MKRGVPLERVRRIVIGPMEEEWRHHGACNGADPDLWFPQTKARPRAMSPATLEAKRICASCPVRAECLEHALSWPETQGTWGGLTEHELRDLRKRRRLGA